MHQHYCLGNLAHTTFMTASGCGMEKIDCDKPERLIERPSCCRDVFSFFQVEDDFQIIKIPSLTKVESMPLIDFSKAPIVVSANFAKSHFTPTNPPPLLNADSFFAWIQVFRI